MMSSPAATCGHTNNMFAARALHCLKDGKLQPVNQPFSYAGFRSKALRSLTLYADKQKSGIVTTIAQGGFVEVVLQDGDFFLLRNQFGLTGWAAMEQSQQPIDIDGFFYNGD
jgi:3-deoxy-D-arabino-heptulosonate 7-phosphate (DAHP) synthase